MILEIKELHFAYKKTPVLTGVNFSADIGQCICLLGENGAGKTTLFRCLLGFLNNYEGEISIGGENAKKLSVRALAKKIAYIPQAHAPVFNYTIFEIVMMGTNVLRPGVSQPGKYEREVTWKMLDTMNITHLAERGYAETSGGERQLSLIARALAQNSKILVMDEPTANLDYGNQFRVMRQIKKLAKQGYLVILSTHNPEHALLYADKVLVLKDGKAVEYGKPKEILNPETIEFIYGVPVEFHNVAASKGDVTVIVPHF